MFRLNQGVIKNRIADNELMSSLSRFSFERGKELRVISFGDLSQTAEEASDIYSVRVQGDIPLWYALANFYSKELGVNLDYTDIIHIRSVVSDYLLRASICYVEVLADAQQNKNNRFKNRAVTDKFLSSKNATIVANFVGVTPSMCANRFVDNFDIDEEDIEVGEIPYIKFNLKTGKIVKCNKNLVIDTCRLVSMPLVSEWLRGVYLRLEKEMVEFTYLKDDDTERSLVATLNRDILSKYYSQDRVNSMLQDSLAGSDFENPFYMPFKGSIDRGWFRLPELGSSIIDDCGTRSINFARIKSVRVVDTFNTSFITVSLNRVIEEFTKRLDIYHASGQPSVISNIYTTLQKYGFKTDLPYPVHYYKTTTEIVVALRNFISAKQYAGTPFKRMLHTYMVSTPELFPNYIGQTVEKVKLGTNFGVASMDF